MRALAGCTAHVLKRRCHRLYLLGMQSNEQADVASA